MVTSFSKLMRTNTKSTEDGLCVLLTPQGICSLGSFLSHPAGMGRKERDGWWPLHLRAPHSTVCSAGSWGTQTMATPGLGEDTANQPTKHRAKSGKQEHRAELVWFEAKLGVRRGKHSPTPGISTGRGSSSSTDVRESTNILLWEAAEQAVVAVEGGRKGNSQLQAQGREGCQLWEQESTWQDVTGEATNKITTYQKGQRAWECSADHMRVSLHTQI